MILAVQHIVGLEAGTATAVGKMLLAVVTLVSLFFASKALRAAQKTIGISQAQLQQTQREIELSRQEVEEAHRPVLVPVADGTSFMNLGADGAAVERRPQLIRAGRIVVPVENVGSGPALNVVATVSGTTHPDEATVEFQTAAKMSGLGVGALRR